MRRAPMAPPASGRVRLAAAAASHVADREVRLDALTPAQRRLVLALIDAAHRNEETAPATQKPGAVRRARRGAAEHPPAA
jgi:hypothetical protein